MELFCRAVANLETKSTIKSEKPGDFQVKDG